MGRRKLRFAPIKNLERKNYRRTEFPVSVQSTPLSPSLEPHDDETPELMVHIPLIQYANAPVFNSSDLLKRLKDFTLPTGWSLEESPESSIALSKSFSYGILKITINCDCCWRIQVNDSLIDLHNHSLLQFQNEKLTSCSTTFQLLKNADRSYMCIGNPDAKFQAIIHRKKGIFLDRFGM